jgi:hypothetical protein
MSGRSKNASLSEYWCEVLPLYKVQWRLGHTCEQTVLYHGISEEQTKTVQLESYLILNRQYYLVQPKHRKFDVISSDVARFFDTRDEQSQWLSGQILRALKYSQLLIEYIFVSIV